MSTLLPQVWNYVVLALGFGFVVFWHELGHFLAAKYCKVKVEQFAVGFGPAALAFRKGIGVRVGTTTPEFDKRVEQSVAADRAAAAAGGGAAADADDAAQPDGLAITPAQSSAAAAKLGLGETEYRLNWIPLGGYVKMLGQDDLHPEATADDPRAYNNRPIRSRMLIVSAGVLMNVLLAGIGFMMLFRIGFHVPPAVVGGVVTDAPALHAVHEDGSPAPLRVGDRITKFDGSTVHNFTNILLGVALVKEGEAIPLELDRADGTHDRVTLTPRRADGDDARGFLAMGINAPTELRGLDYDPKLDEELAEQADLFPPEALAVKPGETIVAVDGRPVQATQYDVLYAALAESDGKPVILTVRDRAGHDRPEPVLPHFQRPFTGKPLAFAGMVPRASIDGVNDDSPARGKIKPGSAITSFGVEQDHKSNPTVDYLFEHLNDAGQHDLPVTLELLEPGASAPRKIEPIVPSLNVRAGHKGLGIGLGYDEQHAVIGDVVAASAAREIPPGSTVTQVAGQPVGNWFNVRTRLLAAPAGQPVTIDTVGPDGQSHASFQITLSPDDVQGLRDITFTNLLALHERVEVRQTNNFFTAASWGAAETRDLILQFYLTLRRMIGPSASVSYKNLMGPVGIFTSGAKFAGKGNDWLIWFLSMISANLAVVNFLPIPIVDGGLFVFLILEKIQGRPLAPNTQKIIQVVGLALILGVFLLVTYQDIARMLGRA